MEVSNSEALQELLQILRQLHQSNGEGNGRAAQEALNILQQC